MRNLSIEVTLANWEPHCGMLAACEIPWYWLRQVQLLNADLSSFLLRGQVLPTISWSGGRDEPALFKQWSLNNHLLVLSLKTLCFTIFREQTSGWPQGGSRAPVYPWWSGVGGTAHCPNFPSFRMPPLLRDLGEGGTDIMARDGISEYVVGRLLLTREGFAWFLTSFDLPLLIGESWF